MKYSDSFLNGFTIDMKVCSDNVILIKRNGFYKRALELWDKYPKSGHPYQLIGKGKLYILLHDIKSAKKYLFKALKIYSRNEGIINSDLAMHCLSAVEHLGYCLRNNIDQKQYYKRISGSKKNIITNRNRILVSSGEEEINLYESKKRIKTAINFLIENNCYCNSFNTLK